MQRTRADLEKENTQLWEKLEAIYDELHELFQENDHKEDDEEEE